MIKFISNMPEKKPLRKKMNPVEDTRQAYEKIKSMINPYNWGVKDYSNESEFNSAYKKAKMGGLDEFMWNNKRYAVKDIQNWEMSEKNNPDFFKNYLKNFLKSKHPKDYEKRYKDILDLHYKYGNPYVRIGNPNETKDYGRANFINDLNTMNIYGVNQDPSKTEIDTFSLIDDYIQELLHARQLKDLGKESFEKKQLEDFKKHNVYYDKKTNKWVSYDNMYNDLKSIEGVHHAQGPALSIRMLYRNYGFEESPKEKQFRASVLRDYKNKSFHPYENQDELRMIQKALNESGYDMSKSLKKDGTYDGIFGKQTKSALESFRGSKKPMR